MHDDGAGDGASGAAEGRQQGRAKLARYGLGEVASWRDLTTQTREIPAAELSLPATLDCGQAFRWSSGDDGAWIGVVGPRVYRLWRDGNDTLGWQAFPDSADSAWVALASYLRLDVRLAEVIDPMASSDEYLARALTVARGLRVLAQEPTETLCSYMCSTANSVPRISAAIAALSRELGEVIATIDGRTYYEFPSLERLTDVRKGLFQETGLEFRGEHLQDVARQLTASPLDWEALRAGTHEGARSALTSLRWVGPKIADCVCLFSLGHDDAVPVDTHIWALARLIFGAEIPTRTLTPSTYQLIDGLFTDRYGRWAGWAQEYLFHWRRQTLAATGRGVIGEG